MVGHGRIHRGTAAEMTGSGVIKTPGNSRRESIRNMMSCIGKRRMAVSAPARPPVSSELSGQDNRPRRRKILFRHRDASDKEGHLTTLTVDMAVKSQQAAGMLSKHVMHRTHVQPDIGIGLTDTACMAKAPYAGIP